MFPKHKHMSITANRIRIFFGSESGRNHGRKSGNRKKNTLKLDAKTDRIIGICCRTEIGKSERN